MRARYFIAIFAACFALFLLGRLPLEICLPKKALAEQGVTYTQASGTLWRGTLQGVTVRGTPLGDVDLSARPFSVLKGRLMFDVAAANRGLKVKGQLGRGFSGVLHARDLDIWLGPEYVSRQRLVPALLKGTLTLRLQRLSFGPGTCVIEGSEVWTDALARTAVGWQGQAPELTGDLSCDGEALVLRLRGEDAASTLSSELALSPSGALQGRLSVRTTDTRLTSSLKAFGFIERAGKWEYDFNDQL